MREPGSRGCPQDRVADVGPGPEREARRDQRGEAREGAGRKGHCDDGKSPSRERGEDEHGGPQPERVGEESPDGVEPPRNAGEEPLERALERPLWIRRDHGADAEQRGHEQNNVRPATRPRLPLGGGEEPQPLTQQLRGDDAAGGARPIGELDAVAHRRVLRASAVGEGARVCAAARPEGGVHDRAHDDHAARQPEAEEDRRSQTERAIGVLARVPQPDDQ